jgi:hypothetical protein
MGDHDEIYMLKGDDWVSQPPNTTTGSHHDEEDATNITIALDALDALLQHPVANRTSLQILLNFLKTHNPDHAHSELITDIEVEEKRCERYGYKYIGRKNRRRIFYGSNIADDSWHTIATHAAEAYGLYHTVALVESNATYKRTARTMRFFPPQSVEARAITEMWGPTTNVFTDYHYDLGKPIDNTGDKYGLIVEDLQRESILDRWIQQGMTTDDLGIISDIDETFTRDFLLAASVCDIPQFRPGQDCKLPKLGGSTIIFESAPECVTKDNRWFHPDMISGECIDGVGDSTKHPKAKRVMGMGMRLEGYARGQDDLYLLPEKENTTMFPLYKPSDFRMVGGSKLVGKNGGVYSAFHLHNFFDSVALLRNKYRTYGHGYDGAEKIVPLGSLHEDIDLAVRCMTNRSDVHLPRVREERGFESIGGMPHTLVAFQNEEYRRARFDEIRMGILEDEKTYGVFNGTYPK